jgi:hypothetical protein
MFAAELRGGLTRRHDRHHFERARPHPPPGKKRGPSEHYALSQSSVSDLGATSAPEFKVARASYLKADAI